MGKETTGRDGPARSSGWGSDVAGKTSVTAVTANDVFQTDIFINTS